MADQAYAAQTTREVTVLAEDPSVLLDGTKPLLTKVRIPAEPLLHGPRGSRIEVIDYDSTTGHFYEPYNLPPDADPYADSADIEALVAHPHFHAHQSFCVASATLFEFENALGRNLSWGFAGHQLKVVPHAFKDANAFYSRSEEALLFGYFPVKHGAGKRTVFTCLSHDIVAHETTHAILDGLRDQLASPSSPDQAAFHEGFADIIALLSNLRSESLIQAMLKLCLEPQGGDARNGQKRWQRQSLETVKILISGKDGKDAKGAIFKNLRGVAKEMGDVTGKLNRGGLRHSLDDMPPSVYLQGGPQWEEPHKRGEILVAAVLQAFFDVWAARLDGKFKQAADQLGDEHDIDVWRVAEEGAKAAQHLMTMVIRAIDYLPPVHVKYQDFLMAMITADWQTCPDDSMYSYRTLLRNSFKVVGIEPHHDGTKEEPGAYKPFEKALQYSRGNSFAMHADRDGMFRFIWENRTALGLVEGAYTRVNSVRPVWRTAPDGFIMHETVVEYYQVAKDLDKDELSLLGISLPVELRNGIPVTITGGGSLIFDEFGRLKFHISNDLNSKRQAERLKHLFDSGQLYESNRRERPFAMNHLNCGGHRLRRQPGG